jgi:hypothetical protein
MMRRRVIEANDAADDRRRFAASAMPENLLAIADQLAGRVEQFSLRSLSRECVTVPRPLPSDRIYGTVLWGHQMILECSR